MSGKKINIWRKIETFPNGLFYSYLKHAVLDVKCVMNGGRRELIKIKEKLNILSFE